MKLLLGIVFTLCLWHACAVALCAASNFTIVDSLSLDAAQTLVRQLSERKLSAVRLEVNEHAARWLIHQQVLRALSAAGIRNEEKAPLLHVGIADCAVRYAPATDRDSLLRQARVELRATVSEQTLDPIVRQSSNSIARGDVGLVENPKYDFTSSSLPAQPRSTWDDLVEPLIILGALATTVIVLFTVRSQ